MTTETRTITGICLTSTRDAHGQVHNIDGIAWTAPLPLRLEHGSIDVGSVSKIWRDGNGLCFEATVTDGKAWLRIESGELRAASVKLSNSKSEHDDDDEKIVNSGTLSEVSVCRNGANPDCIIEVKKTAKPIIVRAEKRTVEVAKEVESHLSSGSWMVGKSTKPAPIDTKNLSSVHADTQLKAFAHFWENEFYRMAERSNLSPKQMLPAKTILQMLGMTRGQVEYLNSFLKDIRCRVEELENNNQFFAGVHQRALAYKKGALVTFQGALWSATIDVPEGANSREIGSLATCGEVGEAA